jgi:hypothetical protein
MEETSFRAPFPEVVAVIKVSRFSVLVDAT